MGKNKLVGINFDKTLLKQLDDLCEKMFLNRSEFIRQAVIQRMNRELKEA